MANDRLEQAWVFHIMQTNCHIQYVWKDGKWSEGELVTSPYMSDPHCRDGAALWTGGV